MDRQCPTFAIEQGCLEKGSNIIAGVDEAGRGALAGPLCIGLVIFPADIIPYPPVDLSFIQDSKKLTARRRESALEKIEELALVALSTFVEPGLIDALNINQATLYAIEKAVESLAVKPEIILLDGNFSFNTQLPLKSVVRGDSLSLSIAAASIVAKVQRDRYMSCLADNYPHYGFEKNMGYGTAYHRNAIRDFGPAQCHRFSYEPMRSQYESSKPR